MPWSASACRAAPSPAARPSASDGRERVGPARPPARPPETAERAALHLEDRHHDPQHRDQQQDAEPARPRPERCRPRRVAPPHGGCSSIAWPVTVERDAGPPMPSAGTTARTAPRRPRHRRRRRTSRDVPGEPARDRALDLVAGARRPVVRAAVERRGVPRPLGRRRRQGVADEQHQRDLEDAQEHRHQHDQDQHEVDHCRLTRAPADRARGSLLHLGRAPSICPESRSRRSRDADDQSSCHHGDHHPARVRRRARRARRGATP